MEICYDEWRKQLKLNLEQRARMLDDLILQKLVGSTITGFAIKPIPRTKYMYQVTIRTTATPIETQPNHFVCLDKIELRVSLR